MNPYRYFSLIFSFPTEQLLQELRELSQDADASGLHEGVILAETPLEELQTEYTRLFISAYPKLLCPPYESYYREGVVYGNSSIEVGEWYRKKGFDFTCEGEPADLVSAELEFLALTNDALFHDRMKKWIFEFIENVKQHSTLYGPAAAELADLLNCEETPEVSPVAG